MASSSNMDPTSFLDQDLEPRVCLLTSSDFKKRWHLEDFEFIQPGRCRDWMSFFEDDMFFDGPSPLQSFAWSSLLCSPVKSLIMQVRNSRPEKLLAYVLPLVVLVDPTIQSTQAICVIPNVEDGTKVLALLREIDKHCSITFHMYEYPIEAPMTKTPQVVIGTDDAIMQLFLLEVFVNAPLKIIVFNDLDQILRRKKIVDLNGGGFGHSRYIMELVKTECQVVLISSTINDDVKEFSQMIKAERPYDWLFGNPKELALFSAKHYKFILKDLRPHVETKGQFLKDNHLLKVNEQWIIYVNQGEAREMRERVRTMGNQETPRGFHIMADETRWDYDNWITGDTMCLITSKSLDREVENIMDVSLVVHATLPRGSDGEVDYIEWYLRSSQAGHLGRSGVVLHLIQGDRELQDIQSIERYFQRQIPEWPQDTSIECLLEKHGVDANHRMTKHGMKFFPHDP